MAIKKRPTQKQRMFAKEYIIDLNASRAYKKVYKCKEETARINSSRLLTNANNKHVQEYIQQLINKRAVKLELKAQDVVDEIRKLAFGNATDFIELKDGRIRVKDLQEIDTTFISGAKEVFDKDGCFLGIELKFHDKSKNLDMLMRHLGQYKDKVEISVDEQVQQWLRGKND